MSLSINLKSNYQKIIEICNHLDAASRILTPFIFKKIISKNKDSVIVEELVKIPFLKNITQETKFEKKGDNDISLEILSGPFSGTKTILQFSQINSVAVARIDFLLKTNIKFLFLKNKIRKKILNIYVGLLNNFDGLTSLTAERGWSNSLKEGSLALMISNNFQPITIYGWHKGAIREIFYSNCYSEIPVKNNIIVDVGANIGDSALYFALKGADKIIAIEPFPRNFNYAKKNIDLNGFGKKIILDNCILTDQESIIKIDSRYEGVWAGDNTNPKNNIKNQKEGVKIQAHNLEYIISKYKINNAVLKMDCEGCEYKTILTSPKYILDKFNYIFLEFHDGYKPLKDKLEKNDFNVVIKSVSENRKIGYLIAKKILNS